MSLRQLRLNARLSVADLAQKSGLDEKTIRLLEAGRIRNPQVKTLVRLADAFGLQPTDVELLLSGEQAAA